MSRPRWVDLASERLGGRALLANDEFFAPKENLLKPGRGVFVEGKYTERGKWMDGWETRRRRTPGHDWCIVRLGLPGVIRSVTVDTHHFRGNHPEACSVDGCEAEEGTSAEELAGRAGAWTEIVPRSPLAGDAENVFPVDDGRRFTHVRLAIHPDGGVARLRVHGRASPEWDRILTPGEAVDLAAVEHGGLVLACSDEFFGEPRNLLLPGRPEHMGDGWETRRRRGPGHDWVVIRLGRRGTVREVEVDTTHFKGNHPESCSLDGLDAAHLPLDAPLPGDDDWREILPRTKLRPDTRQRFGEELTARGPVTHVRLRIHPDGGVARLRVRGLPADDDPGSERGGRSAADRLPAPGAEPSLEGDALRTADSESAAGGGEGSV